MKNNLKEFRLKANLTQEQLASLIGTQKQYISSLETGNRDISKIRTDTMERICLALGCETKDLFSTTAFEYNEDGKLIVDNLYLDSRLPNNYIIEIEDEYFIAPNLVAYKTKKSSEKTSGMLRPMFGKLSNNAMELDNYMYVLLDCVPRKGFEVKLGRAITEQEFSELKERFNLNEDSMTSEFETSTGNLLGKSATKYFTAIQIKVDENEAISLQNELQSKGIEAINCNVGLVNIRVK